MRRQRNVDRRSGLRLIEHQIVTDEARPLKGDRIPDTQTTPSHQERERPKASAVCGPCLPAIFPVRIRCVNDLVEFLTREVVRWRLIHSDAAQAIRRVLSNPSSTNAEPEEAGEAFLLLLLGEGPVFPRGAVCLDRAQVEFTKEFVAFGFGPRQKLFAEDDVELVEGRLSQFAGLGVRQIFVDGPFDSDRFVLLCRRWSRIFRRVHLAHFGNGPLPATGFQALADIFVADHSLDPSRAGAALVIAVCALAEGGIVTTVDGKHAAIIVQLSYRFATSILDVIPNT